MLDPFYSFDMACNKPCMAIRNHQAFARKYCEALYDEAHSDLMSNEEIQSIDKYIRYLMGHQWVEKRPSYKSSPVDNKLWTNLIKLVSFLTDIRQSFVVQPLDSQLNGTAEKLNKGVRAWFVNQDVDMVTAMVLIYSALSTGYMRQVWNPDLENGMGDIEVIACGPKEVMPIKPTSKLQGAMGLIYEKPMPLSWFSEKFSTYGDLVKADESYSSYRSFSGRSSVPWYIGPAFRRLFGLNKATTATSVIPMGRYQEYWLKDNHRNTTNFDVFVGDMGKGTGYMVRPGEKLYPRGRLIIKGGDVILFDGPNPHWHGRFPFAALRINQVPWQWPGVSEFRNQIPMQDTMNNILAGILDLVKRAVNPPMHAPINAFSDAVRKNLDPNKPGITLWYNQNVQQAPGWAQVAQLPSYVFETMLYARDELTAQAGFLDAGNIAAKKIIPSDSTLDSLSQGQQTMVRLKVRYIETFFREVGEQWIANAFQKYHVNRRLLVSGLNGLLWQDFEWNWREICPQQYNPEAHWKSFKWIVMPGSLLKSSRTEDKVTAFKLRGQGDMDRRSLLKTLDMEPMIEEIEAGLKREGAEILINMLRQKMSGVGGGSGLSPEMLNQLNDATQEKPAAIN